MAGNSTRDVRRPRPRTVLSVIWASSIRVHRTDLRDDRVPFVLQLTNGRSRTFM